MFISCDWGTTRLRLRAVRTDGVRVAAEHRSLDGVAALARQVAAGERAARYRTILADGIKAWSASLGAELKDAPVIVSGMASSSIGWEELPYAPLPLPLDGSRLAWRELEPLRTELGVHRVVLISGASSATDVMRGEETEIVGLFALDAARPLAGRSLVIKPGTHSKHLRVEAGQIVGLQTFMTGELAEVLGRHSVLAHSIDRETPVEGLSDEVVGDFRAGVRHALALPLAAALFRVRTRQVLDNLSGQSNRAFLSGVLVGSELAYLGNASLAGVPLVLCATSPADAHYRAALEELGLSSRLTIVPADEVELLSTRGQMALMRRLGFV